MSGTTLARVGAGLLVLAGGFAVMVLEIAGARYLARDFGASFYVWISQIGVVLAALAIGYAAGGALADKFNRAWPLSIPLAIAGGITWFIPVFTPPVIRAIVMRHPLDQPIPLVWQKLDPVLGSTLVFFLPCLALAILSPYVIRLAAQSVEKIGTVSGLVYASSTAGSIAGVFVSGYVLLDLFPVSTIFRATGLLLCLLSAMSLGLDRWMGRGSGATANGADKADR